MGGREHLLKLVGGKWLFFFFLPCLAWYQEVKSRSAEACYLPKGENLKLPKEPILKPQDKVVTMEGRAERWRRIGLWSFHLSSWGEKN